MNKKILVAAMVLVGSYAFADGSGGSCPTPSPAVGTWNMSSRACTSNAAINDGVSAISATLNADNSYDMKVTVSGCVTETKGTYAVDGMKYTFTSATVQGCNDTAPVPTVATESMYAAYMNATQAVIVATGASASAACPAGDALILDYQKAQSSSH